MMEDLKLIYRRSLSISCLLSVAIIIVCLSRILQRQARAKVTGRCDNCHIMHNSQDGTAVDPNGPNQYLLAKYCVGCHSATDGSTWKDNITGAPIVYNTAEPDYAKKGLAGGNFYYVTQDQSKGHNVTDIPGVSEDDNFPPTPGRGDGSGSKNCGGCHDKATHPNLLGGVYSGVYYTGCQFCHGIKASHHADDATIDGLNPGTSYRFLKIYVDQPGAHHLVDGVKGIEDDDWEKTVSEADHNEYCGADSHSISGYCAHCHGKFHGTEDTESCSPWLRHPSDIALPSGDTEYAAYTIYSPESPIARDPTVLAAMTGPSSTVTPGTDQVSCLSCHRAHGSPYADMLRWNYSTMEAGGTTTGGCFTCHTTKNGL